MRNKGIKLSAAFSYRMSLELEGTKEDRGYFILTGTRVARAYGCCEERLFPYPSNNENFSYFFKKKITNKLLKNAQKYRIQISKRLFSLREIKLALALGRPVIAGVKWYDTESKIVKGLIEMPKKGKKSRGYHAVTIIGYNEKTKRFQFQNSWGVEWGNEGYGYFPYNYIKKYCGDAFSLYPKGSFCEKIVDKHRVGFKTFHIYQLQTRKTGERCCSSLELRKGNKVVGWLDYEENHQTNNVFISELFIIPEFRKKGLGTKLIFTIRNILGKKEGFFMIVPFSDFQSKDQIEANNWFFDKNGFKIVNQAPYPWSELVAYIGKEPCSFILNELGLEQKPLHCKNLDLSSNKKK